MAYLRYCHPCAYCTDEGILFSCCAISIQIGVCGGVNGTGIARSLRTKCIFRVGRGLAPAVSAPSDEGAVKCAAFDWGRDFTVSLPPSRPRRATSLVRGRNNGRAWKPAPTTGRRGRRPLRTKCNVFTPPNPNLCIQELFIMDEKKMLHDEELGK